MWKANPTREEYTDNKQASKQAVEAVHDHCARNDWYVERYIWNSTQNSGYRMLLNKI